MQATLKLSDLYDVMDMMLRFVSKHATLPVLEHIYMKAQNNVLTLRATDMEKYVEIELPIQADEDAMITVNARTFNDIIRTIDDEYITLHINQSKDEITIETPRDNFCIKGIAASEYVAIPSIQAKVSIEISPKDLSEGINKVEYAVTEKNFSPIMTGILMRTKEYAGQKKLVFVGTDSFRLAEYKIAINTPLETNISLVIPKIHVLDIKKVLEYMHTKGCETITLQSSDAMMSISAEIDDIKITSLCLLIQGNFPEYENENIMPTSYNHVLTVDKMQCEKAIKKIGIITKSLNNYIAITTDTDMLHITSGVTDLGEGKTSIPASISGEEVRFGLNGKYLSDFIKNTKNADIQVNLVSGEKPIIFKDPSDEGYTYVIRPLVK